MSADGHAQEYTHAYIINKLYSAEMIKTPNMNCLEES